VCCVLAWKVLDLTHIQIPVHARVSRLVSTGKMCTAFHRNLSIFITYDGTIFSFFNFSNGAIDSSNLASRNDNGSHNIELCTQGPCARILHFVTS